MERNLLGLLVLLVGIYYSYSRYSISKEREVIRTTVGEFISGDIVITPYIDGEYSKEFPKEEVGINVEKVLCDNDSLGEYDSFEEKLKITNLTVRTKCNVYFVSPKSCGVNDNVKCISNREELFSLGEEVNNGDNKSNKIYYLTSDIDLGGKFDSNGNTLDGNISWTPIGTEDKPFSGVFDGNGHIISNMYISSTSTGLFNYINKGKIKNLGIENAYIKNTSGAASSVVGTIRDGEFSNIYSNSVVDGYKTSGGLIYGIINSRVKNSYFKGSLNSNGKQFGAGIVGYVTGSDSIIKNCYNLGSINGAYEASGIVGGLQGMIDSCYNLGNISGNQVGGIAGQYYTPKSPRIYNSYNSGVISSGGGIVGEVYDNYDSNLIKNNYYLEGTASYGLYSISSNVGSEVLSKDKMPSVISIINKDNAFVEDINNINGGYPVLKWQVK